MKKEMVELSIISETIEETQKLENALNKEIKSFRDLSIIVSKNDNIQKLKNTNILIIILNGKINEQLDSIIQSKHNGIQQITIINLEHNEIIKKYKNYDNISIIENFIDIRAMSFSILYEYYAKFIENINIKNDNYFNYDKKILDKYINNFESNNEKEFLSQKIDIIILEGTKCNFKGYEGLKKTIIFCIVNKIDKDNAYNYIYDSISKICMKQWQQVKKEISSALLTIRKRTELKIQEILQNIKGKSVFEQVLTISKIVNEQINIEILKGEELK